MPSTNYLWSVLTSHAISWFYSQSNVVKDPNPSQILKGCLSSLLTSLAELICIYTWIFNISWKILLTLHFDLHFGLHQLDNFWTWNLYFCSFFQYILHRIGLQQMKIYVNFSFWSIEVTRGRPRPLWRPHFDCDLEWPPNIALWVLFPNNSKFFYVTSCDRFPIGHLGRQMTVGTPSNSICNQNSASHWPRMTSNWKSIATFYIKKLWVIRKKYPQDHVRR